ncbi:hypothetical protein HPB52_005424 [Rhipicephalus sanguineus]|uniref:Uncharacterized protein n=1 Tax=Rhipicephalus sanguineus TaxID=34632 RepID=A0A9D4QHF1_RHISA|nr:hypothetical protein HPB52_005424 [Rhipicephalus sanguineus]
MHPEYNNERRKARAAPLVKAYGDTTGVTFADATEYQDGHCFAATTTQGGSLRHAASIVTHKAETAEEVAIALAALDPDCDTIVSDSRTAVNSCFKGRISQQALRILHQASHSADNQITLVWIPAHAGNVHPHLTNLIEVARSVARGLLDDLSFSGAMKGGVNEEARGVSRSPAARAATGPGSLPELPVFADGGSSTSSASPPPWSAGPVPPFSGGSGGLFLRQFSAPLPSSQPPLSRLPDISRLTIDEGEPGGLQNFLGTGAIGKS